MLGITVRLFTLALLAIDVKAQSGELFGRIIDPQGRPVSGARLSLGSIAVGRRYQ